jgi:uncharacterized membrane protein
MITDTILDWLHLAARWIHVFAGIMWVGQTYFFTWLDGRFSEMTIDASSKNPDSHVWMVHSGGFYLVDKQRRPTMMPTKLHWFRWEAAITWLSGITLLVLVYYMGGLMVDENMEETVPMIAGIAAVICAWPVYDALWRSKIARNETAAVIVSYLLLVGAIFGLTHFMGGRAAYIHAGAMLGTLMTMNVWMRILPPQRKMVAALQEGKEPDLALGEQAKMRSKHNTFMAVPVVFIMISNHFPVTSYGDDWNWVILSVIILVGWGAAKVIRRA